MPVDHQGSAVFPQAALQRSGQTARPLPQLTVGQLPLGRAVGQGVRPGGGVAGDGVQQVHRRFPFLGPRNRLSNDCKTQKRRKTAGAPLFFTGVVFHYKVAIISCQPAREGAKTGWVRHFSGTNPTAAGCGGEAVAFQPEKGGNKFIKSSAVFGLHVIKKGETAPPVSPFVPSAEQFSPSPLCPVRRFAIPTPFSAALQRRWFRRPHPFWRAVQREQLANLCSRPSRCIGQGCQKAPAREKAGSLPSLCSAPAKRAPVHPAPF